MASEERIGLANDHTMRENKSEIITNQTDWQELSLFFDNSTRSLK